MGLAVFLLLSGCNPDSGSAFLEVVYPSGYVRTYTTWDELTPMEGDGLSTAGAESGRLRQNL